MNGPEHFRQAELLLTAVGEVEDPQQQQHFIAAAQVHAALAQSARQALNDGHFTSREESDWIRESWRWIAIGADLPPSPAA